MINIGSLDADKIYIGNDEVDKIFVGNDLVWSSSDEFIMNVSSVTGRTVGLKFQLTITGYTEVTFDNETQTFDLDVGETSKTVYPTFSRQNKVTDNLIIKGKFTNISTYYQSGGQDTKDSCWETNYVVKWYKNNELFKLLFYGSTQDITIPSHITKIYMNRFRRGANTDVEVTLPSNVEYIEKMEDGLKNATFVDDVYYKDNIACGYYYSTRTAPITIQNGTKQLAAYLFNYRWREGDTTYTSNAKLTGINFPTDGLLTEIPDNFMEAGSSAITTLSIPSSITKIGKSAFKNFTALTDIYFYSNNITLPTAGSSTGMLYCKSSKAINVYTDNKSITEYDWSVDNNNPTFYHIDGTTWAVVAAPTISVTNNVLSIAPNDNLTDYYKVDISWSVGLSRENEVFTTTNTTVDLSPYLNGRTTYTVKCIAMSNNPNVASGESSSATVSVSPPSE